jgi:zinc and cadmium transporter
MGVAIGLSLHSFFDGLALAAAVASGTHGHGGALGLGTALAVILHKPFGALAIITLMAASGSTRASRHLVNLAFALVTPLGALLFYLGAGPWAHEHPAWPGCALAFCAGTFLCIACADLLPELQFHAHDRFKLSLALLAGLAVAVAITRFGHPSHEHESERPIAKVSFDMNVQKHAATKHDSGHFIRSGIKLCSSTLDSQRQWHRTGCQR